MTEESSNQVSRAPAEKSPRGGRSAVRQVLFGTIVGVTIVCTFAAWVLHRSPHPRPGRLACQANLKQLGLGMLLYASDHGDAFPAPEKWCDLLLGSDYGLSTEMFRCRRAGAQQCSYAMNPDANPRGNPDTVLLFESGSGWNQAGGPELLTTVYHDGCNVVFVDGTVRFVKADEAIAVIVDSA